MAMSANQLTTTPPPTGRTALYAGGLAAILASTCCLGPLVLLMLGFSGAWIGNLTALEPYRPYFVVIAMVALFFAYRQIFRPAVACQPDCRQLSVCRSSLLLTPEMSSRQ
jgi:mercuric ion transport protein